MGKTGSARRRNEVTRAKCVQVDNLSIDELIGLSLIRWALKRQHFQRAIELTSSIYGVVEKMIRFLPMCGSYYTGRNRKTIKFDAFNA